MQVFALPKRSMDDLEDHIVALSERLNSAEYEFLVAVREFDIRQGWKAYLFNNCAEWLNFKCGIVVATAREKVRTAQILFGLPKISEAFKAGKLSYSNVRALTRVATPRNEQELLEYALPRTASQVEQHCRALRNANRAVSTPDANRIYAQRYFNCNVGADGTVTISIELPLEQGQLVAKAIEKASNELVNDHPDVSAETSFHQQQADAFVHIVSDYLAGSAKASSTADHYQVVIHADEAALKDEGGKSELPVESVRRISCDSSVTAIVEDKKGNPLEVGRKKRVVSPQLKRALVARDKQCRYPGCCHEKWLDAHHMKHWIDGGETTMENLVLLCSRHHRLLHEGGFKILKNFEGAYYFKSKNGRTLADHSIAEEAAVYHVSSYDSAQDGRDAFYNSPLIRLRVPLFSILQSEYQVLKQLVPVE